MAHYQAVGRLVPDLVRVTKLGLQGLGSRWARDSVASGAAADQHSKERLEKAVVGKPVADSTVVEHVETAAECELELALRLAADCLALDKTDDGLGLAEE